MAAKQPIENVGIRQVTVLLNAGYPLDARLQQAIAELVSAAARAGRRTRKNEKEQAQ